MGIGLKPAAVVGLVRELRAAGGSTAPLQVSGVLAEQLARELRAGGSDAAVRTGGTPSTAAALIVVLGGAATEQDEQLLRAAARSRTPTIAVQTQGDAGPDVPYVLATDVVVCPPGAGFPVEEIARALAHRLGQQGPPLAARLPVLRGPVCDLLISSFSRRSGVIGAAVFVPGADLPILTLNQLRLVLQLAAAHGVDVDEQRAPEILATIGNGLAFRALAREVLGFIPFAGWAVKGALAYAGTKTVGEAAVRWFARNPHEPRSVRSGT
jgi:uncharacterized protein (DUF697 family)